MNLDQSFEQVWTTCEDVDAGTATDGLGLPLEEARPISKWFVFSEARKRMLKAIADALATRLDRPELLDLCSGYAIATRSLLGAGKINHLIEVDINDEFDHAREAVARTLRVGSITHICELLGQANFGAILPEIQQVTLIDTGLALPLDDRITFEDTCEPAMRCCQTQGLEVAREKYPRVSLRFHVPGTSLRNILLNNLGARSRRVLLIDRSVEHADRAALAVSGYMDSFMRIMNQHDRNHGWEIKGIDPVDDGGTVLVEMKHQ